MPAPSGFDHVSTTKSNSTRSIAAHPCKQRKDGAPSVRMVHAKIVKGGPPAIDPRQHKLFDEEPRRAFWQARFYDFNVWTTKKRVEKLRYMHRNPVKRGLVESPEQWRWSSYRHYLLDEDGPVRVNVGWGRISFQDRVA
jgi:hypothetical protein